MAKSPAPTKNSAQKAAPLSAACSAPTPVSAPGGFRHDLKELWGHFAGVAGAGIVIGGLTAALATTGATGVSATAQDLWSHAWAIHPFFYVLVACVVCAAVVLQGQDLSNLYLDRYFTQPLLSAMAHTLSFAAGLLIPLCFVTKQEWASVNCHGFVGSLFLLMALVVFALMAVSGLIVVERRMADFSRLKAAKIAAAQLGTQPAAVASSERAGGRMLLTYLALTVLFVVLCFVTGKMPGATEHVVSDVLKTFERGICAR